GGWGTGGGGGGGRWGIRRRWAARWSGSVRTPTSLLAYECTAVRRQRLTRTPRWAIAGPASSTALSSGRKARLSPMLWTPERAGRDLQAPPSWDRLLTPAWPASGQRGP